MNYDQKILHVLCEAGEQGLSVHKIAVHVHNSCNSLFNPVEFRDVYRYVTSFLARNSRDKHSILSRTSIRGHYRLNPNSTKWNQLMLQFEEEMAASVDNKDVKDTDKSLSLF